MRGKVSVAFLLLLCALAPLAALGEEDPEWQQIGRADEVIAMTAMDGKLFAVTRDNRLWGRDPVPQDIRWQLLGSANRVVALAGVNGRLFGATRDHKLWMRESTALNAAWRHIGYADVVTALTAVDGKLYAVTKGNRLLVSDPVPWNIRWQQVGDAAQVLALAGLAGKLWAVSDDQQLWLRDPAAGDVPWQHVGHARQVVALAGLEGRLFAATRDNKLWMRGLPEELQVVGVSLEAPDWLTAADYASKVVVTLTFNRAVRTSTLAAPDKLRIDLRGMTSGNTASAIFGTFQLSSDARTVVFISDRTLTELLRPQANEDIEYRIALTAPEWPAGVLHGEARGAPHKDGKQQPRGQFVKVLRKPYVAAQPSEGRVF